MTFEQRLRTALDELDPDADVRIDPSPALRFVVMIYSSQFEGVDEAQRQAMVWEHLRAEFSDAEMIQVEYVFTESPSERAA